MKKYLLPVAILSTLMLAGCSMSGMHHDNKNDDHTSGTTRETTRVVSEEDVVKDIAAYNNMHLWIAKQIVSTGGDQKLWLIGQKALMHGTMIMVHMKELVASGVVAPIDETKVALESDHGDHEEALTGNMKALHMITDAYEAGLKKIEAQRANIKNQDILNLYNQAHAFWGSDKQEFDLYHEALHKAK